jgi:glycosyltransferase involved in cell wall biosynthesis
MLSLAWHLLSNHRDYQIVHAHGTYQHSIASVICRLLGKRSILKIAMANSDIAFDRQGRLFGRVNRFFVGFFDRYIATSAEVYEECLSLGLEPSKILQIPNGVDINRFQPVESDDERRRIRRELSLPDTPIACFVGVLDARKNVDGVLRIWRSVIRRGVTGHLVIVGPEPQDVDGQPTEYRRQLQRFIDEEQLDKRVTFAGRQADVASYLRGADVFVFPSRREGMPNVVLEAMASGVPCVASKIGGSADLIDTGRTGYLFDVDDDDGMSAAVTYLLSDPIHAREVGRAARETICSRFSIEATADRYAQLYRDLILESKAESPPGTTQDVGPP